MSWVAETSGWVGIDRYFLYIYIYIYLFGYGPAVQKWRLVRIPIWFPSSLLSKPLPGEPNAKSSRKSRKGILKRNLQAPFFHSRYSDWVATAKLNQEESK